MIYEKLGRVLCNINEEKCYIIRHIELKCDNQMIRLCHGENSFCKQYINNQRCHIACNGEISGENLIKCFCNST